ncbi:MAG: S9 family peptidase [Ignavibacteriae bacterium]|nr:S9 family peptidase [Ignavibacteriota bacterium]
MKKSKLFFYNLFILLILPLSYAQNKTFTIEDVVFRSGTVLTSGKLDQLKWLPNNYEFSYLESHQDDFLLVKEHVKNKMKSTVVSLNELNRRLKEKEINLGNSFPKYEWIDNDLIRLQKGKAFYYINVKFFEIIKQIVLPDDAANIQISPDNNLFSYTKENNLFIQLNGEEIQITKEENKNILNGHAVHRNEFGIEKGIFWSPSSKSIAFYRMDESMVTDYPLVKIDERPAKVDLIKYPMAGMTSHEITIGIYNLETKETIWLKTGEPKDQYLTSLTWDPSEKYFYVGILNRDQNHLQMKKYDAVSGNEIKILFEEKDNEFVEPENPLFFLPYSNDFLWLSERDGYNHLYRYSSDGELIKQVTKGDFPIIDFIGFDSKGENAFFTSNKENVINKYLYKVELSSSKIVRLTNQDGTNNAVLSDDKSFFINRFNSIDTPNKYTLNDTKGNEIRIIKEFVNPLTEYSLGKTEFGTLKAEDGTELQTRIIYPTDFDETKKYPVILYVYGGPHYQGVTNSFISGRYDFWYQYMAQNGFIVFELDNRGTANRGIDFEQKTFRNLGSVEVKDQMTGINYLKSLPYVDTTRFGVFGWSYGGFMTTSLMLRTDDVFKVGVAGGAVIDWSYYEVMYTERYMDTPETNPDGYKESNLLNYVENLEGKKLLLVHGTVDPVVVWQHTLLFTEKATNLNKPVDYYPYPGYGHHVYGKDLLGLFTKITNYFLDNL